MNFKVVLRVLLAVIALGLSEQLLADVDSDLVDQTLSSETIPYRSSDVFSGESVARLSLALGLGVSLVVLSVWGLKKVQAKIDKTQTSSNKIHMVELRKIMPKLSIIIVDVNDKTYVLAQNNESVVKIDEYDKGQAEQVN